MGRNGIHSVGGVGWLLPASARGNMLAHEPRDWTRSQGKVSLGSSRVSAFGFPLNWVVVVVQGLADQSTLYVARVSPFYGFVRPRLLPPPSIGL